MYIQNRDGNPTNNYPEYICRIGANDIFEWRLGVNYSVGSQGNVVTSVEAGELTGLVVGALYESNFLYGFKLATIRSRMASFHKVVSSWKQPPRCTEKNLGQSQSPR